MFDKFGIRGTPTVLFLDPDGSEVDWIVGYGPPVEKYQDQVNKVLAGVDTFKSLSEQYAKDPKSIEVIFKMAGKYDRRGKTEKATEFYKQVIALDPEGKKGMTEVQNEKVSYTQGAEFNLASMAMSKRPPDASLFQAFIKKYSDSPMVKQAYMRLSSYYRRTAPKEEATKFFEEYIAKFPQDADSYSAYVSRIISDKDPLDKGIDLAQKAVSLTQGRPRPDLYQNLAQLYLLKGDKGKAAEAADQMIKIATSLPSPPEPTSERAVNPMMMAVPMAARIYVDAGQLDKALAIYGPEYLNQNMDNFGALGRYAQFWSTQGQNLESALAAAKKATELSKDNYSFWNTLSDIFLKQKKYDDALKAAEKALEIAPAQPAQIKESIKKRIEAIKAAQEKK
jgi:tetratricopeptide (TPR) repeat protein